MLKYAGVIVLYNPKDDVIDNIRTYIHELDRLYVVDNSEGEYAVIEQIKKLDGINYINLHGNHGLSIGLNRACNSALQDGYDFVLTMDQDSSFMNHSLKKMIEFNEASRGSYAIIAPNVIKQYYAQDERKELKQQIEDIQRKDWVITTGSLMDLRKWKAVGGFDEKLFIEFIDVEICLQFHKHDYPIIQLGQAELLVMPGNARQVRFLGRYVYAQDDNPVRSYYLFRNGSYISRKHGRKYKKFIGAGYVRYLIKVVLYEKKKLKKLRMICLGLYDGLRNKNMGKCKRA